jgi:hypothetical protein|tara:strand:+ start:1726 stop:1908 length:183 start_codon:yes stop_codon:yes gene_type:complete
MLALYTEEQLGAAYQIYVRVHAAKQIDIVDFETYRTIFENQYMAMTKADGIFDGAEATTH